MDQEKFINQARRNPCYVGYKEHPNGNCTLYFRENSKFCCQTITTSGTVSTPKFVQSIPEGLEL